MYRKVYFLPFANVKISKINKEVEEMAIISLIREIKLTNEDAIKILDNQPSEKLQEILHLIKQKEKIEETENKLISKYL